MVTTQTQYQGPWCCWLFWLQAFPQHRRHSQHEALGGWRAHLWPNLAAGVRAGVLVGTGTGCEQGFGWLVSWASWLLTQFQIDVALDARHWIPTLLYPLWKAGFLLFGAVPLKHTRHTSAALPLTAVYLFFFFLGQLGFVGPLCVPCFLIPHL